MTTVVFLFSDIEGSTRRWERFREAMGDALRRHDDVLNAAIVENGGRVFKTIGDAFCAVFETVPAALRAAAQAQRALAAADFSEVEGMRVRMAVHAGLVEVRDGDYFGPAVNRVARLLAIGHGGQILLSNVAADLAENVLPDGYVIDDLGTHRLKDLTSPERVRQLRRSDSSEKFPALRSLESAPNNLPIQLTGLVGRDAELAEIRAELEHTRLLTLAGSGGIGKTRIALQVAADELERFEDGAWLLDLAPLSDPLGVASELTALFSLAAAPADRSALDVVVSHLQTKRTLIVFDNCEHLLGEVAVVVEKILRGAPRVTILATSREQLGIASERVYRMPSLGVPPQSKGITAEQAERYGSVALFVERARAQTSFVLRDDNAPAVAEICRRLDGIALAIELAASRLKVLSVAQLAQRLNERFRVLTGGSRTALPRQQTMRALIDWSYDLLDGSEQTLFRRLAVFVGGMGLEAVEAVCADEALDTLDVLELLAALVDKSLVAVEESGSERRYRFLETIREYAAEKLDQSAERDALARRHAEFFKALAERAGDEYLVRARAEWLADYLPELDNFRSTLKRSLAREVDPAFAAAFWVAVVPLFQSISLEIEIYLAGQTILSHANGTLSPGLEGRLMFSLGDLAYVAAQGRMDEFNERAIALLRVAGDRRWLARALRARATRLGRSGRTAEARDVASEAVALARELGDPAEIGMALGAKATALGTDEIELARADFAEGASLLRAARSPQLGRFLQWWGESEFAGGDCARALAVARESLAVFESLGELTDVAMQLTNIAGYAIAAGDVSVAREAARAALAGAHDVQDAVDEAFALQHAASVAAAEGSFERAARLLGFTDVRLAELEIVRYDTERLLQERLLADLRAQFDETQLRTLMSEGGGWTLDRAFSEALSV